MAVRLKGGDKMSYESISHSRWDCKYHVVFIPKCRREELYGKMRKFLGQVFHEMARQKGCKIEEGHMVQDHVHMLIKIPPKYSVAEIVGYIKGKSAIAVARQFGGRKRNFNGEKGILHEAVYTFSCYGCIQVSGVRTETCRTCAVLKANAANLNTETRPSFQKKCKLLLLDFERCRI